MMKGKISPRDHILLSAYLDGQLTTRQRARLEARLKDIPQLRTALEDLDNTRALLRSLPRMRSPRNFTLTPAMAGIRRPERRAYPVFSFVSTLASVLFVIVLISDFLGLNVLTLPVAKVAERTQEVAVEQFAVVEDTATMQEAAPLSAQDGSQPAPGEPETTVSSEMALKILPGTEATLEVSLEIPPESTQQLASEPPVIEPTPVELLTMTGSSPFSPTVSIDYAAGRGGDDIITGTATTTATPIPTETPVPTSTIELLVATPQPTLEAQAQPASTTPLPEGQSESDINPEPLPPSDLATAPNNRWDQGSLSSMRLLEIILALMAVSSGLIGFLLYRRTHR